MILDIISVVYFLIIKNAISIAGLLLTTKYMIINDGYIKIDNSIQTI